MPPTSLQSNEDSLVIGHELAYTCFLRSFVVAYFNESETKLREQMRLSFGCSLKA